MNVIQYTMGNMDIEDVTTIFGAILDQSAIEFTMFNVEDGESIEIINDFYANMKTLNTDVGLLVKIDSEYKELSVSSRKRLQEVLKEIEDRGINIFIIKADTVFTTLSFMADYIMNISPLANEDNAYMLNVIKHMDISAFKEESMRIKFDENNYIYFHEIFLDTMNDIQRCILRKGIAMYFDSDSGDIYLTIPQNVAFDIEDFNIDEVIEEMTKQLDKEFSDEYKDDIKNTLIGKDISHVGNIEPKEEYDWLNSKDKYSNNTIRKPAPLPKKLRIKINGEEV